MNKALEMKPDYFEAITYINLLYREKAKIEADPAKKKEYTETRRQVSCAGPRAAQEGQGARRPPRRRRRNRGK